jgi:hypothetical protein
MKTITDYNGVEHVIIDRGNDEFISMPKVNWDALDVDSKGN